MLGPKRTGSNRASPMASRSAKRRLIKKNRLYTYEEASDLAGVTAATVRSWRSRGLQVMTASKPHYILGAALIAFLNLRKSKRSASMNLDQMYCFTCKEPQKPLCQIVDYIPINDSRGRLTGLCIVCEGALHRFVGKRDLGEFAQLYDLTIKKVT